MEILHTELKTLVSQKKKNKKLKKDIFSLIFDKNIKTLKHKDKKSLKNISKENHTNNLKNTKKQIKNENINPVFNTENFFKINENIIPIKKEKKAEILEKNPNLISKKNKPKELKKIIFYQKQTISKTNTNSKVVEQKENMINVKNKTDEFLGREEVKTEKLSVENRKIENQHQRIKSGKQIDFQTAGEQIKTFTNKNKKEIHQEATNENIKSIKKETEYLEKSSENFLNNISPKNPKKAVSHNKQIVSQNILKTTETSSLHLNAGLPASSWDNTHSTGTTYSHQSSGRSPIGDNYNITKNPKQIFAQNQENKKNIKNLNKEKRYEPKQNLKNIKKENHIKDINRNENKSEKINFEKQQTLQSHKTERDVLISTKQYSNIKNKLKTEPKNKVITQPQINKNEISKNFQTQNQNPLKKETIQTEFKQNQILSINKDKVSKLEQNKKIFDEKKSIKLAANIKAKSKDIKQAINNSIKINHKKEILKETNNEKNTDIQSNLLEIQQIQNEIKNIKIEKTASIEKDLKTEDSILNRFENQGVQDIQEGTDSSSDYDLHSDTEQINHNHNKDFTEEQFEKHFSKNNYNLHLKMNNISINLNLRNQLLNMVINLNGNILSGNPEIKNEIRSILNETGFKNFNIVLKDKNKRTVISSDKIYTTSKTRIKERAIDVKV